MGCKVKNMKSTLKERSSYLKRAWDIIEKEKLPIIIDPPVYAPCPYSSYESAFYIDLFGNIYTCGGFVGRDEKIERTIDSKSIRFWERIQNTPKEHCFKCSFFPVCMGGCTFEAEKLGGKCQYNYLKEMHDEYYTKYANK